MAAPGRYGGRPGIPPALALLVATGQVSRGDCILDVGCGTGTDALLLARWGFRRVVGVDPDARAIATARGRATRMGLSRRVRFEAANAEGLPGMFGRNAFDVVLHTLVANNLRGAKEAHFAGVAAVLRKNGLLLLHERIGRGWENVAPGRVKPLAAVRRHFDLSPGVTTQLAERPEAAGPGYAKVAFWIGRPRRAS